MPQLINQEFVDHCRSNQPLKFIDAFQMMRYGFKMKRGGWHNLKSVRLVLPTEQYFDPYFEFIKDTDETHKGHIAISDMLLDDWIFVD